MPFIDSKITVAVDAAKKEELKAELGKLMATLHKSETYLMVGIEDKYDLWFGGKKLVDAAHAAGAKVIRSMHKFDGPVKNLEAKLRELGKKGDIAKIAFMPRNLGDVAKAFAVARNLVGTPFQGVRGRLGEPSLPICEVRVLDSNFSGT